jgi:hypothetical protein
MVLTLIEKWSQFHNAVIKMAMVVNIISFINGTTALCWALASSSVSQYFLHSR